jgi:hypothetical protein
MIARLQFSDAFAYTFHDARRFVAQHTREEPFRVLAAEGVLVGVAQCSGNDLDTDFARAGGCNG